jgi:quinol monooxygenase YgiN
MYVAQDDPNQLVLVERWASRDAFDAYVAWRKANATGRLSGLYAAPPAPRVYDAVEV